MKKRALVILSTLIVFTIFQITIANDSNELDRCFCYSSNDTIKDAGLFSLNQKIKIEPCSKVNEPGEWINFISISDKTNTNFIIRDLTKYIKVKLTIYNSWGKRVFKSENYQNDFDARYYPEGTYYYQAWYTLCDTGEEICKNSFFEVKKD